jgi:small GTP-binding protein
MSRGQKNPTHFEEYRMTVVGAGGTGKSALTVRFIQGNFPEKYDPTIEDSYRKCIEVDGKMCIADVMDTAGQNEYSALRDQYMKTGEGFLIVYSITSRFTFEVAAKLRSNIIRMKNGSEDFPIVLVGNKKHCEAKRQVSTEEGQKMAEEFGCPFLESSAKNNENVTAAFFQLIREIDRYRESRLLKIEDVKKKKEEKSCVACKKKLKMFTKKLKCPKCKREWCKMCWTSSKRRCETCERSCLVQAKDFLSTNKLVWSPENHTKFPELIQRTILAVMMLSLKNSEGKPKYPDVPFQLLPNEILFHIFHWLILVW